MGTEIKLEDRQIVVIPASSSVESRETERFC
jgi:hypothetical protein